MNVNKKKLAEIFGVDVRTITAWQNQGLPLCSGGGKGTEAIFDTTSSIGWFAQREADIENEKLRKEVEDLRAAAETDLQPGSMTPRTAASVRRRWRWCMTLLAGQQWMCWRGSSVTAVCCQEAGDENFSLES